jgi:hypothetical protein
MARHKLSAMFSDLRGALNGSKFSKGRSCHTLTNKVKGSNPQSATQSATRTLFRQFTTAWKGLTDDARAAWNQAAQETSKSNAFGDSYKTTGHKLFVAQNVNSLQFGGIAIPLPVVDEIPTMPNFSMPDPDSDPQTLGIAFDTAIQADETIVIAATGQLSPGKSNVKGLFRVIKTVTGITTPAVIDCLPEYTAKFGTLVAGKKIHMQAYMVSSLKVTKFKAGAALAKAIK